MLVEEEGLDYVLVPCGLGVMVAYHGWLLFTILRYPNRTVIGINADSRRQWVHALMADKVDGFSKVLWLNARSVYFGAEDPLKNGTLAVQTIRNNIMASTLLATTAITLSSLIGVVVSSTSSFSSSSAASTLIYGNESSGVSSIKYFSILLCFLVAFLFNVQSIRYYAHVSFLVTLPTSKDNKDAIEYVTRNLYRGSIFWSLGLRAFYFSFPLFLWIFGPIPMFVCCCVISSLLYFLDTTSSFTRQLHTHSSFTEEPDAREDVESADLSQECSNGLESSHLYYPLLRDKSPVSSPPGR